MMRLSSSSLSSSPAAAPVGGEGGGELLSGAGFGIGSASLLPLERFGTVVVGVRVSVVVRGWFSDLVGSLVVVLVVVLVFRETTAGSNSSVTADLSVSAVTPSTSSPFSVFPFTTPPSSSSSTISKSTTLSHAARTPSSSISKCSSLTTKYAPASFSTVLASFPPFPAITYIVSRRVLIMCRSCSRRWSFPSNCSSGSKESVSVSENLGSGPQRGRRRCGRMEIGGERRGRIWDAGSERVRLCNRDERPRRRVDEGCVVKGVRSVMGGSERGSLGEGEVRCEAIGGN